MTRYEGLLSVYIYIVLGVLLKRDVSVIMEYDKKYVRVSTSSLDFFFQVFLLHKIESLGVQFVKFYEIFENFENFENLYSLSLSLSKSLCENQFQGSTEVSGFEF